MVGALAYRPWASPLHATRASIGALWIFALVAAALLLYHPVALLAIALVSVSASLICGLRRELTGALHAVLVFAVPIVILNVLVSREGLTVFARIGDLGPFGQGDLTVEALVYGAVIALKVGVMIVLGALATFAIDPDQLLARVLRLSFRSGLTASISLRMVPLLAADAQRFAEAQRTRPVEAGGPRIKRSRGRELRAALRGRELRAGLRGRELRAGLRGRELRAGSRGRELRGASMRERALLLGATFGSALDRALDVAATLELRGFTKAHRQRGVVHAPLSRHDAAFLASALAVLGLALAARVAGLASFRAYPLLSMPISIQTLMLSVALSAVALAPLLDRKGIQR